MDWQRIDVLWHFNSHAHVERDRNYTVVQCDKCNFNSHAHVERDGSRLAIQFDIAISTHTLTWSVTVAGQSGQFGQANFNSHAHVERDQQTANNNERKIISTHTLTWSVTKQLFRCLQSRQISTHTLTWSVTPAHFKYALENPDFNSHAHVERDDTPTA